MAHNKHQTLPHKISLTPLALGLVGLSIVFLGIISLFAARDSEVFIIQGSTSEAFAYRNPFRFNIGAAPATFDNDQQTPNYTFTPPAQPPAPQSPNITINLSGTVTYQYMDGTTGPAKSVKVQIPATYQSPVNTTTNDSGVYNLRNVSIDRNATSVDISIVNPYNGVPIWKKVSVNGAGTYYSNFSIPARRAYATISGNIRVRSGVATIPASGALVTLSSGQTTFADNTGAYKFVNVAVDKEQSFEVSATVYMPSLNRQVTGKNSVTISPTKTNGSVSVIMQ